MIRNIQINDILINAKSFVLVFFIIMELVSVNNLMCQPAMYSQLSQTQLVSNPAFAGIMYGPRLLGQYRTQYPRIGADVNSGFTTMFGSYDQFFSAINSGFGVQVLSDKIGSGILNRIKIEGQYAYQIKFNRFHALRIGLSGTYNAHQLDFSRLQFYDQIDPILGFNSGKATAEDLSQITGGSYWNANAGVVYFRSHYYIGLSAQNLFPKPYLEMLGTQSQFEHTVISVQAGGSYRLGDREAYGLFPAIQYDRAYQSHKLTANLIGSYKMVNAGIGARYNFDGLESLILITGLNFNKFRITYSYDAVTNKLGALSGGSHEVGIRFLIMGDQNSLIPDVEKEITHCPDFMRY